MSHHHFEGSSPSEGEAEDTDALLLCLGASTFGMTQDLQEEKKKIQQFVRWFMLETQL